MTEDERLAQWRSVERIFHAGADALKVAPDVRERHLARLLDAWLHSPSPAAFADGPVADTAEPVTPQAGVAGADSDGDDVDAMLHG